MDIPIRSPAARDTPTGSAGKSRRWARWRWLIRAVLGFLLLSVALFAVLAAFQERLIFPGHATQGRPEAVVQPGDDAELVNLATARGDRIVALFGTALSPDGRVRPDAATRPTILYFYGNGMSLKGTDWEFEHFRRLGANVLIPEYVGYGMSHGSPGEVGCYATADAAFEYLLNRKDVDPKKIVVAGWSLGAAVAVDLAARAPVAGLAIFSGFTSMVDMARRSFPFLPANLLLQHRFASEAKLPRVACPILIAHGQDDRMIPPAMADRLARAAGGPVTRVSIAGAGHNDFFTIGGDPLLSRFAGFLDALP